MRHRSPSNRDRLDTEWSYPAPGNVFWQWWLWCWIRRRVTLQCRPGHWIWFHSVSSKLRFWTNNTTFQVLELPWNSAISYSVKKSLVVKLDEYHCDFRRAKLLSRTIHSRNTLERIVIFVYRANPQIGSKSGGKSFFRVWEIIECASTIGEIENVFWI